MSKDGPITFAVMLGSLRKASFNGIVARALPGLAPADVTIQPLASVGALPIYDADIQAEGFPAEVTAMADAVRAADGVIIISPEYNYSIPGGLKNAIDWLSRLPNQPFAGKPIAIQTASMSPLGGVRCQYHLRQSMVFLDARILNKPEVIIGAVHTKVDAATDTLTDETTRGIIKAQLENFAAYARRHHG
ncbi:chromate reductase [Stella humosa]|uniref:Chromate reductase n=1 Tax=Stella humosa TaxID=94 RepID=A0A3N1LCF7_9PROT|nr:NADPH-dependent FMN reductase [Stella humosa]ROP90711.1 chromate reductase [Stella humosa]BBK29389.1 chromate reductase [Stella humosa]